MSDLRGRALIESRFGKLGSGQKSVVIGDAEYDLPTLLARMDLNSKIAGRLTFSPYRVPERRHRSSRPHALGAAVAIPTFSAGR